mgnify:CR=1 FL=1
MPIRAKWSMTTGVPTGVATTSGIAVTTGAGGAVVEVGGTVEDSQRGQKSVNAGIPLFIVVVLTLFNITYTVNYHEVAVATRSRDLAAQQLTQARDRFAAGVANNVEVVQAQEAVAASSEQYISAFYAYNSAKALLARDLGEAEAMAFQLLGGGR